MLDALNLDLLGLAQGFANDMPCEMTSSSSMSEEQYSSVEEYLLDKFRVAGNYKVQKENVNGTGDFYFKIVMIGENIYLSGRINRPHSGGNKYEYADPTYVAGFEDEEDIPVLEQIEIDFSSDDAGEINEELKAKIIDFAQDVISGYGKIIEFKVYD